ncbi:MAG: serine/threonine-protein kinase [Marmoricola sp.]
MPDRLGRYPVHRRIGSGAFATVWLARDEQLDSPVAVKVLADNWAGDELIRRRFVEEGRYLRRVESPHVVTVYDAGELDDGRPYLVMTYADQGTLADRLETAGAQARLTTAQSLRVVVELAAGLQALHDRSVLHRDVKPANVLFRSFHGGSDVRAMIGDLGLGKAMDMSSRLTLAGGTPSYVAPEQAAGQPLDESVDQYSLAAVAYLLLTGRRPFTHVDLASAADPGPVPTMSTSERPFAPAVESVLARGLARNPEERYASVTAFATALTSALQDDTGEAPAVTTPGRPWLPMDGQLTAIGSGPRAPAVATSVAAPVAAPVAGPGPGTTLPRRSRVRAVLAVAAAAVLAFAAAGAAAYGLGKHAAAPSGSVTLTDATRTISVTVPGSWERFVSRDGWVPPEQRRGAHRRFPALWAGSNRSWNDLGVAGRGVFAAVLPSTQLPGHLPEHPDCDASPLVVGKDPQGNDQATTRYTGCPEGVVIEQATMIGDGRLLWVQVHADSAAQATDVLRTVAAR